MGGSIELALAPTALVTDTHAVKPSFIILLSGDRQLLARVCGDGDHVQSLEAPWDCGWGWESCRLLTSPSTWDTGSERCVVTSSWKTMSIKNKTLEETLNLFN